jgi:hypothetical protein
MDGLIAQAVHYTDCFEFDKASKRMKFVADSLKMQSNRFHELMPQDFPEKLRFDLRARALGTLVQSEIFAGATDSTRLTSARRASEEAIAEFTSFSDRARQYQYRCHLETVARDYATARKYLIWSLERTESEPTKYSHEKIADLVTDLSIDPEWKSEFTLLHWLRIGAYACLDAHAVGDRAVPVGANTEGEQIDGDEIARTVLDERDEFLAAIDRCGALKRDACEGRLTEYPAHSILRFVAVINTARGNWDESIRALQCLHALDPIGKEQLVLAMILLAAQAEVASVTSRRDPRLAELLLRGNDPSLPSLSMITQQLKANSRLRPILTTLSLERLTPNAASLPPIAVLTSPANPILEWARANAY